MVAIFVILTIAAFIAIASLAQWFQVKNGQDTRPSAAPRERALMPAFALEGVSAPGGFFVDAGHTWVTLDPSGRTHIGMDEFVQRAIGRIDEVKLPQVGQEIHRGGKLFAIRQGNRMAVFTAPVHGVIGSVNESLARHPEAIQSDPYTQGWICGLRPKNLAKNLKQMFIAEEARTWLNQEIRRFQEFIASRPLEHAALGDVLQDGGQPTSGVLELMDNETWNLFTSDFLEPAREGD